MKTTQRRSVEAKLRPRAVIATAVAMTAAGLLFLSDRASALLGAARERFDAPQWFPWSLDNGMLHMALWMGITILATLAVRSVRARLLVGGAVILAAAALEYLQTLLTFTRRFEVADIVANSRGVYAGLTIGLIVGGMMDRMERRRSRL